MMHGIIKGKPFTIVSRFVVGGQAYYSVKYADGKLESFSEVALLKLAPDSLEKYNRK